MDGRPGAYPPPYPFPGETRAPKSELPPNGFQYSTSPREVDTQQPNIPSPEVVANQYTPEPVQSPNSKINGPYGTPGYPSGQLQGQRFPTGSQYYGNPSYQEGQGNPQPYTGGQGYSPPYSGYQPSPPPQWSPSSQQQQTVIIGGQAPVIQHVTVAQSFVGHFMFSCFVFWCCNSLFGLIAFILAAVASNQSRSDPTSARQLGYASIGTAVAGIVITITLIAILVPLYVTGAMGYSSYSSSNYCSNYYGVTLC